MSRYNHWWYELTKPFRDAVFVFAVVPLALLATATAYAYYRLRYNHESAVWRVEQLACRRTGGHVWDGDGTGSMCHFCGAEREST